MRLRSYLPGQEHSTPTADVPAAVTAQPGRTPHRRREPIPREPTIATSALTLSANSTAAGPVIVASCGRDRGGEAAAARALEQASRQASGWRCERGGMRGESPVGSQRSRRRCAYSAAAAGCAPRLSRGVSARSRGRPSRPPPRRPPACSACARTPRCAARGTPGRKTPPRRRRRRASRATRRRRGRLQACPAAASRP